MSLENLFTDLISVPGLRMVICFERSEPPVVHHVAAEKNQEMPLSPAAEERLLRGIAPVVRQLRGASARIELRGENGRFVIRSLGSGSSLVCVTNNYLNLPLLELALDAYTQAAEEDADAVVQTFRRGEMVQLFADLPKGDSSLHSYSSFKILKEKLQAETAALLSDAQPVNRISFATGSPVQTTQNSAPATAVPPTPTSPVVVPPPAVAPQLTTPPVITPPVVTQPPAAAPPVYQQPVYQQQPQQQPVYQQQPVSPQPSHTAPQVYAPQTVAPIPPPTQFVQPPVAALTIDCAALSGELCQISAQAVKFLGRSVVANYWKQTQPENFRSLYEVSMDGNVRALKPETPVSADEYKAAGKWAQKFVERCSFIVTDITVEMNKNLSGRAAELMTI